MVLAKQVVVFRAERKRQRLMLKCDYGDCYSPADHIWVEDDDVQGLCEKHFEREQENEDDGYTDGSGDEGSHRGPGEDDAY